MEMELDKDVCYNRKSRSYDMSIGSVFGNDVRSAKMARVFVPALSVLIVDDSITQRKLATKALGGEIDDILWMVDTAENGERAMQLVQNSPRPPDVIIIDQNMESTGGRLLGHEVVAKLRTNIYFRSVVIIGCTGFFEAAERHFIDAGCDAVWPKPIPSKEIAQSQINQFILLKKRILQQQWYSKSLSNATSISFTTSIPKSMTEIRYNNFNNSNSDGSIFEQVKEEFSMTPYEIKGLQDRGVMTLSNGQSFNNSTNTAFIYENGINRFKELYGNKSITNSSNNKKQSTTSPSKKLSANDSSTSFTTNTTNNHNTSHKKVESISSSSSARSSPTSTNIDMKSVKQAINEVETLKSDI
jgi:CheY-like chemotaxis protein